MTSSSEFDALVANHVDRLKATIVIAAQAKSLDTVDKVTAQLAKAIGLSEMIRCSLGYTTEQAKVRAFKSVVDHYTAWAVRHERRVCGFYPTDTFPKSFHAGVIIDYRPPSQP